MSDKRRAIGYARGDLVRQGDAMEAYCAEHNLEYVETYSGDLTHTLNAMAAHKAEVLIVTSLDRLTRSIAEIERILDEAHTHGWQLFTIDGPVIPDISRLMDMFAAFEAERQTGERQTEERAYVPCANCGIEVTTLADCKWVHVPTSEVACADDDLNEQGLAADEGYGACPEHNEDGTLTVVMPA